MGPNPAQDLVYYTRMFTEDMKRDPTNVELFDIAQSNSEHRRGPGSLGAVVVAGAKPIGRLFCGCQICKRTMIYLMHRCVAHLALLNALPALPAITSSEHACMSSSAWRARLEHAAHARSQALCHDTAHVHPTCTATLPSHSLACARTAGTGSLARSWCWTGSRRRRR